MTLLLLVAYASGIAMTQFVSPWQWSVQCVLAILFAISWFLLRHRSIAWLPCLGLLFLCGQLNASLQLNPPAGQNHIAHFANGTDYAVEGTLLTVEHWPPNGYRLLIDTHLVAKQRQEASVSGKVLLYVKQGEFSAESGQVIRWRSRLRRPTRFGNPGEFDYPLYLAAQDIYVTSFVEHAEDLVLIINHPLTQKNALQNLRQKLAKQIEAAVPSQTAGLMQSLLLGKRDRVSLQQRELLAESGTAHLFAISGLHFGLLALFLYVVGKWVYTRSERLTLWCPPQRILPLLLLVPLFAYLLLTGNAWGTRRAFIMIAVVAFLLTSSRRTQPLSLLATTAMGILLFNPLALFQAGFQLSFSGVAGILVWLPVWQKPFQSWNRFLKGLALLFLTTAAATLATAPASLWHFHQFAPAGLVSNLFAIPLIAWGSVPIGLVSLALFPVSPFVAETGLQLSALLVEWAMNLSSAANQLPGFKVIPYYLTTSEMVLLVGVLLTLFPFKENRRCLKFIAVLCTVIIFTVLSHKAPEELRVTAFSVGQGDATLVSLGGAHYLVDGGGLPNSSIDTGARIVAPALGRLGVKELAGVLLTHNHPDHSRGLAYVLDRFRVKAFYSAAPFTEIPEPLREVLHNKKIPFVPLPEGWQHITDSPEKVLAFFIPSQSSKNINERSVAVFVSSNKSGVLLTADLGRPGLKQLITAGLPGPVNLLKLPHHGSRHAAPKEYFKALAPEMAFVSAGKNNVYKFPHQATIDACDKQKAPLYRTDQSGMLSFFFKEGKWSTTSSIN